ncbi:hypothetical protein CG394_01020 [Gardnerella vaginalis]|uniref:Uncharacterized protein n=1 Tax=Gardnerella vaginalis (strain ATCC 14019 / 317) TaxID=525284 RepID=E3D9G9_GARV3|nr:hypothetical protein HMPREF0421_20631 [Gardnerella vaginalis ATCC 14019]EPI53415.1 hypothetical protein HMPREF1575_00326 [Gardnerella vaginalis JCP7672]PKZ46149.1 hypothetical protein CYJ68_03835 [Gardnerella vaginalis]TCH81775.1 hypothetical protein E0E46_04840 [Gardnerella vaginalis ATCC 14018 = JCM 11026]PKZ46994.1 hypothetical protein CYJ67_04050 [Gardnerella vaginalis]
MKSGRYVTINFLYLRLIFCFSLVFYDWRFAIFLFSGCFYCNMTLYNAAYATWIIIKT